MQTFFGQDSREANGSGLGSGAEGHRIAAGPQFLDLGGQTGGIAGNWLQMANGDSGDVWAVGYDGERQHLGRGPLEETVKREVEAGERLCIEVVSAPRGGQGLHQGGLLIKQLQGAVPDTARLRQHDLRVGGQEVGKELLIGMDIREPVLHAVEEDPVLEPIPLRAAPWPSCEQLRRRRFDVVARNQLSTAEEDRRVHISNRALVGHAEGGQSFDLITPKVDTHRLCRRRGKDVDDATPHGELPTMFDRVLPAVPHAGQPPDEGVELDFGSRPHQQRCGRGVERAEPLQQRPDRRHDDPGRLWDSAIRRMGQAPSHRQSAPHGLDIGTHPFERERLPGREGHSLAHEGHQSALVASAEPGPNMQFRSSTSWSASVPVPVMTRRDRPSARSASSATTIARAGPATARVAVRSPLVCDSAGSVRRSLGRAHSGPTVEDVNCVDSGAVSPSARPPGRRES